MHQFVHSGLRFFDTHDTPDKIRLEFEAGPYLFGADIVRRFRHNHDYPRYQQLYKEPSKHPNEEKNFHLLISIRSRAHRDPTKYHNAYLNSIQQVEEYQM